MHAWAKATGGEGKIDYLADGSAKFVSALGLAEDKVIVKSSGEPAYRLPDIAYSSGF